ncbi:MAG: glycosyltransferase [Mycobacterium sp.]|nr:glycosyltransferase [Mycobacterium sp.]
MVGTLLHVARFVVVTPVLDCAHYIQATLDSVGAQTDGDWIHYLIDGGSSDGTLQLVLQAAERDSRRRVIRGSDSGMYDALFEGFDLAAADGVDDPRTICVWINGDDLLMPWAFARLRQAFDESNAQWITAIPAHWDSDGRLAFVSPYLCWYPSWLIRAGQFHGRSLGWIQQESTFFTYGLLSSLSADAVAAIRTKKLCGDFLLWREFAKYASPYPLMTPVAGFRQHNSNMSTTANARYFAEIEDAGVWIPPPWLGRLFRRVWNPFAMRASYRAHQREVARFWSNIRLGSARDEPITGSSGKAIP